MEKEEDEEEKMRRRKRFQVPDSYICQEFCFIHLSFAPVRCRRLWRNFKKIRDLTITSSSPPLSSLSALLSSSKLLPSEGCDVASSDAKSTTLPVFAQNPASVPCCATHLRKYERLGILQHDIFQKNGDTVSKVQYSRVRCPGV